MIELLPDNAIGAELGVFQCEFSKELLDSGKFETFFLVDPFIGHIGSGDKDGRNHQSFDGEYLNRIAKHLIEEVYEAAIHYRLKSLEFFEETEDDFLDFVYIDTTHRYEDTLAELEESYRCTKPGGIVAGHDFNLEGAGVRQAVEEFCSKKNIPFNVLTGDGLHSFYFYK